MVLWVTTSVLVCQAPPHRRFIESSYIAIDLMHRFGHILVHVLHEAQRLQTAESRVETWLTSRVLASQHKDSFLRIICGVFVIGRIAHFLMHGQLLMHFRDYGLAYEDYGVGARSAAS